MRTALWIGILCWFGCAELPEADVCVECDDPGGKADGPASWSFPVVDAKVCSLSRFCFESPQIPEVLLIGTFMVAADDIWAVGKSGTVLHWNGQAWSGVVGLVDADLHAVWASGPEDVWIVGGKDVVFHGDGTHFERVTLPTV